MSKFSEVDINNLIHNQSFIDWALHPEKNQGARWQQFIEEHPEHKEEFDSIIFIIRTLQNEGKTLSQVSKAQLWEKIEKKSIGRKNTRYLLRWVAAASILLAVTSISLFYYLKPFTSTDYTLVAKVEPTNNDIKLIFSDQSEKRLTDNDAEIKYDKNGKVEINNQVSVSDIKEGQKPTGEELDQLVVPLGKRSSLILSDGTKLWLNSGSRAIFPKVFRKNKREIYIEGEAYLEVAHNAKKPFYVATNLVKVKVLGTKFNVSAYPDDKNISVVLVQGSVQATIGSETMLMKENQLLSYETLSGKTSLEETDVLRYISWKDGWLYCNKEKLESITTKLARYYNVSIQYEDNEVRNLTLSGKLDLKSYCEDIFKVIESTAPMKYKFIDGKFILYQQNK